MAPKAAAKAAATAHQLRLTEIRTRRQQAQQALKGLRKELRKAMIAAAR
jgi:hypothetical protein